MKFLETFCVVIILASLAVTDVRLAKSRNLYRKRPDISSSYNGESLPLPTSAVKRRPQGAAWDELERDNLLDDPDWMSDDGKK